MIGAMLEKLGAEVHFSDPGPSCPIIYARVEGDEEQSVLLYHHYDTLPAGDVSLWESDPFVTEVRGGQIFARGISDNKGDLLSRIHAIRAFLETRGSLPITVKFLIEGEEYAGSPHLRPIQRMVRWQRPPAIDKLERIEDLAQMTRDDYRDAWSWVHFFLHGPVEVRVEFQNYLMDVANHTPPGRLSQRIEASTDQLYHTYANHFSRLPALPTQHA